ncbi:MAG: SDR family NAD(P)-dependent oxidoreductase [Spirochaeta sp.]|nr:SDR family NAD(P)-dependent oxidoreductase [Spirochaeta sp.]
MNLQELINISRYFGTNPDFILEGGGNTSIKSDRHLYIKASGISLADISASGFVKLERKALAEIRQKDYPAAAQVREAEILKDLLAARSAEDNKRPSVETLLHDLLPQRYVVHSHPAMVNALTCARNGKAEAESLLGTKALWIPSVKPGLTLALTLKEALAEYARLNQTPPQIILLQNHGLVIGANSPEEIKEITRSLIKKIESRITRKPDYTTSACDHERVTLIAPVIRTLLRKEKEGSICVFHTNREIAGLVRSRKDFEPLSSAFTPDHIVYSGHRALFIPAASDMEEQYHTIKAELAVYQQENGCNPRVIAIQDLGIFTWGKSKKEADAAFTLFLDATAIAVYAESFGGFQFMTPDLISFIREWEVEAFRKKVALGKKGGRRFSEKIAVVTGGARGIGGGLAEALVQEGCNVMIADLAPDSAVQKSAFLCGNYGAGKAASVEVDVSDETSIKIMIFRTVAEYGGIDILVSNAGVLKAGGLESLDLEDFRSVTEVNYTGYFLATKHASRVMKLQHRFNREFQMDIIQINSKSGLTGSNKNFAYAGSKFGGIGLTQSFALELVEHNIKVNSICPGNFFDGPLWSDPEKGLFIQYLKARKVPGARSIADVRKHYESVIPMKRGCRLKDIVRALFYIIEQEYETGQVIPVTGGQIMLR